MTAKPIKIEMVPIGDVLAYAKNARLHSDAQVDLVAKSITEFGFVNPCLVDKDGVLIAGHCRILSAAKLGMKTVPVIRLGYLTEDQARALRLADNALPAQATWDVELIQAEIASLRLVGFDIPLLGFSDVQLQEWGLAADGSVGDGPRQQTGTGSLSEKFGVPPFSVLNAREGWWQDRKRAWIAIGIQSELGRGGTASTSARVGDDDPATYRTIGGRATAIPGGSRESQERGAIGVQVRQEGQRHAGRWRAAGRGL